MLPAAEQLAEYLQTIDLRDAEIPIIQNVDVKVRTDSEEIKKSLVEQLHQPVRWSETIIELKSKGVDKIVECGPGKVLTGLCKRIDRTLDARALFDIDSLEQALSD
jgi:[acyl-carrier-protein] S-malonyltransferase